MLEMINIIVCYATLPAALACCAYLLKPKKLPQPVSSLGHLSFFDLPRELRDQILAFAVVVLEIIICKDPREHLLWNKHDGSYGCTWHSWEWSLQHLLALRKPPKCPCGTYFALCLVNRYVNKEATSIFFGRNRLGFQKPALATGVCYEDRAAIGRLTNDQICCGKNVVLGSRADSGKDYDHINRLRRGNGGRGWVMEVNRIVCPRCLKLEGSELCKGCMELCLKEEEVLGLFLSGEQKVTVGELEDVIRGVSGVGIRYVKVTVNIW